MSSLLNKEYKMNFSLPLKPLRMRFASCPSNIRVVGAERCARTLSTLNIPLLSPVLLKKVIKFCCKNPRTLSVMTVVFRDFERDKTLIKSLDSQHCVQCGQAGALSQAKNEVRK